MGDLISRVEAQKSIYQNRRLFLYSNDENMLKDIRHHEASSFTAGVYYAMDLMNTILSNMPTAYDVDKVVAELDAMSLSGSPNTIKKIYDIVKRGGIYE